MEEGEGTQPSLFSIDIFLQMMGKYLVDSYVDLFHWQRHTAPYISEHRGELMLRNANDPITKSNYCRSAQRRIAKCDTQYTAHKH